MQGSNPQLTRSLLNIVEEDGSPSTFPYKLKVTNGTLTDNGDGTASLNTGGGSSYTDEMAQDAVGGILVDTDTVNLTYVDGTPSITADVITQMSITSDASGIKFVCDATSPGNSKYYGTDGSGNKGYHTLSASGLTLQTNGTPNGDQTLLNLIAGTGVTLADDGVGGVTICSSGGGGSPAGADYQIQYYDGGVFGAQAGFRIDKANVALTVVSGSTSCAIAQGSLVHGYDDGTGGQCTNGFGSQLNGYFINNSSIYITGNAANVNVVADGGTLTSCGAAGNTFGHIYSGGQFNNSGTGSEVSGSACTGQIITGAGAVGGKAFGFVVQCGSLIESNGYGTVASGYAYDAGIITACGSGSYATGNASGCGVIYAGTDGAFASGIVVGASSCSGIYANSYGAMATGYVGASSFVQASNSGAHAHGYSDCGSLIYVASAGGHAFGTALNSSTIQATSGYGNWAGGSASDCGNICSIGVGSGAFGSAPCGGGITSSGAGSLVFGQASGYGSLSTSAVGSLVTGYSDGSGSTVSSCGNAAVAHGSVTGTGGVIANGEASMAIGKSSCSGSLVSTCGVGAIAHGYGSVCSTGNIFGTGDGSFAGGVAACGDILGNGRGAIAHGYTDNGYTIDANGDGCFAMGSTLCGPVSASCSASFAFGENVQSTNVLTHSFGSGFANNDTSTFQVGYGGHSRFKVDATNASVKAGTSTGHIAIIGGKVYNAFADVGNATTTQTDLDSYTVPANALNTDGEGLSGFYSINILGSATATSQFKVFFAGTAYFDSGALALAANGNWQIWVELVRTSSSTARISTVLQSPGAALTAYTNEADVTGLDFTTTNILKLTGTRAGVGAASGDILFKHGKILWEAAV